MADRARMAAAARADRDDAVDARRCRLLREADRGGVVEMEHAGVVDQRRVQVGSPTDVTMILAP